MSNDEVSEIEVPAKVTRRQFPAEYKARMLAEYERLPDGEKDALLRREGLYSSLISEWRKQAAVGAAEGLANKRGRPGPDARHDLDPKALTIHSDRGVPAAKPVAQLLATLEITRSVTRPRTPNDNPYSESQFRTMKYRPQFPASFAGIDDARGFCVDFFRWHNLEHRHSGIGFHTPASVYFGTANEIQQHRADTLTAAFAAHPERFVAGPPQPPELPETVYINPPQEAIGTH